MGYRSDVAYGVKFYSKEEPEKSYAQFIKFYNWVKRHTVKTKEGSADYAGQKLATGNWHLYWNVDRQMLCFQTEGVKWYDAYSDVQWHQELLKKVKEFSCAQYVFKRIGEADDDVEVDHHTGEECDYAYHVDIMIETRIVADFPEEIDFIKEVPNDTV